MFSLLEYKWGLVLKMRIPALALMVSMVYLGSNAFAQDLSDFTRAGKLTPHVSGGNTKPAQSLMIYRDRGVIFRVSNGQWVGHVIVFQPRMPLGTMLVPSNSEMIVPGGSAYGIALGMSREQVRAIFRDASWKQETEKRIYCVTQDGRRLMVSFDNDRVSQIQTSGYFTTTEGVTERSSEEQIIRVYGIPDQHYDFQRGKRSALSPLTILLLPLLGWVAGHYMRKLRVRVKDPTTATLQMAAFGAMFLVIADLLSKIGLYVLSKCGTDWLALCRTIPDLVLTGAGSAVAMKLLSDRVGGILGRGLTLIGMLAVALAVSVLVNAMGLRGQGPSALATLAVGKAPFIVFMFLSAGSGPPGQSCGGKPGSR